MAIYRKFKLNERIHVYFKFAPACASICSVQVETMDPSVNSTPMDLLNATEDSSPCNLTPMNRAHALGVSVGEARREVAHRQYKFRSRRWLRSASGKGHA